jgi:PBP1b-binding outer membrane lipoprotein LpoB
MTRSLLLLAIAALLITGCADYGEPEANYRPRPGVAPTDPMSHVATPRENPFGGGSY